VLQLLAEAPAFSFRVLGRTWLHGVEKHSNGCELPQTRISDSLPSLEALTQHTVTNGDKFLDVIRKQKFVTIINLS